MLEPFDPVFLLHDLVVPLLLQGTGYLIHRRAYPQVEVGNLVKEECLEELHLPLNVPKIPPVNLLEDPRARIVNGRDTLLLNIKNLTPHAQLEVLELSLMHDLPF